MQPLTPMQLVLFQRNEFGLLELVQMPDCDLEDELTFTAVLPYYLALVA